MRDIVIETIGGILVDKKRCDAPIADEDRLMGTLGLDSLDLAVLVVRLEARLGCDPFQSGRNIAATVGELVDVYRQAQEGDV